MSKTKDKIIEGYPDPTNGLWWSPPHHPSQNNKQSNMLEHITYNHIRTMAPRHLRAYLTTSHKYLSIFYHHILCCPKKRTLIQEIKDGSFGTWTGLTERLISKYLPESEITVKGNLNQNNQQPAASAVTNVTHITTKLGENKSELLLQLFDPTKKNSDLTEKFPEQSDRGNNYILMAYHYGANNILTTQL